jgi:hypothetical protein
MARHMTRPATFVLPPAIVYGTPATVLLENFHTAAQLPRVTAVAESAQKMIVLIWGRSFRSRWQIPPHDFQLFLQHDSNVCWQYRASPYLGSCKLPGTLFTTNGREFTHRWRQEALVSSVTLLSQRSASITSAASWKHTRSSSSVVQNGDPPPPWLATVCTCSANPETGRSLTPASFPPNLCRSSAASPTPGARCFCLACCVGRWTPGGCESIAWEFCARPSCALSRAGSRSARLLRARVWMVRPSCATKWGGSWCSQKSGARSSAPANTPPAVSHCLASGRFGNDSTYMVDS